MTRTTIEDIAQIAKVSAGTVSRVLNNKTRGHMRLETKKRILEIIKELNYKPNLAARALRKRQSKIVMVCVPDILNPFFPMLIRGIENTLVSKEYSLILFNANWDARRDGKDYLKKLQTRHMSGLIDGIIVGGFGIDVKPLLGPQWKHVPTVLITNDFNVEGFDIIMSDDYRGAYEAVQHLVELGHRRVAHIGGLEHPKLTRGTEERKRGYCDCLRDFKIENQEEYIVKDNYWMEDGYKAMNKLLRLKESPTAVFVASDFAAFGAIRAIIEAGLNVPEDISVVGFDDIVISRLFIPSLTTVSQPIDKIGAKAASLLFKRINSPNPKKKEKVIFRPRLTIRESTARPKKG
jgi:LacI family transcriptional regulator